MCAVREAQRVTSYSLGLDNQDAGSETGFGFDHTHLFLEGGLSAMPPLPLHLRF
jgi:hypothetical protein